LNLGLALAERTDRRTILIDCNFRDSRMDALLGAKKGPGMTELIQGQATLDEAIQPTAYPNLFFLSAGRIEPSQAGEFMCRPELKTTVDALRKQFDYILVDTPAMNVYSDAGITGLLTGDALLVVRMKKTSKEDVDRAIRSLRSTNVRIMGMLLTHRPRGWFTK
jgi:capsular exopolysaccharide synthesis family protein